MRDGFEEYTPLTLWKDYAARPLYGVSMLGITELLEKAGYQTRSGKRFQVSTIKSILGNRPLYEGMYKYGDMNWVKGVHEPILKGVEV